MYIVTIIAAGGRGSRLGADVPKQFLPLGRSTVLEHSLDTFDRHARVDEIVVVLPADMLAQYGSATAGRGIFNPPMQPTLLTKSLSWS